MTDDPIMTFADTIERIRALAENGPLPAERQLAQLLNVNRYMLRKALARLRISDEIPASKPRNAGKRRKQTATITMLSSPAEVWEVRLSLEPEITRLAAVRGTELELRKIELCHAASEPRIFDLEKDIAFHHAIAVASHNALALHLMEKVLELTREETFRMKLPEFTTETGWRHHAEITAAIRDRHAAKAEAAMRSHLTAILSWLNGSAASAFSVPQDPPPKS